MHVYLHACVCMCMCMSVCVSLCMCACVCLCVCVCALRIVSTDKILHLINTYYYQSCIHRDLIQSNKKIKQ